MQSEKQSNEMHNCGIEKNEISRFILIVIIVLVLIVSYIGYKLIRNTEPQNLKQIEELNNSIIEKTKAVNKLSNVVNKNYIKTIATPKCMNILEIGDININNFRYNSKDVIINTNEFDEAQQNIYIPEFYTVNLKDYEKDLKAVAWASLQETGEAYHKSLSIIVSMLAFFGIAVPSLVILINYRIYENELKKFTKATIHAESALQKADIAIEQANLNNKHVHELHDKQFNMQNEIYEISGFQLRTVFDINNLDDDAFDIQKLIFDLYCILFVNRQIYALYELIVNGNETEIENKKNKKRNKEILNIMDNVMGVIKDIFDHINDVKQDLTSQQKYIESDINLMKKLIDDIRDDDIMNLNLEINNDKYHDIVDKIYLLKINIKVLIEKLLYLLNQNVSFIR